MLSAMHKLDENKLDGNHHSGNRLARAGSGAVTADASGAPSTLPQLLEGRRLVVTGVATRSSIAFAVADLAQQLGAEVVLTSFGRMRRLTERAAHGLPRLPEIVELDVTEQSDFTRLHAELSSSGAGSTAWFTRSPSRRRMRSAGISLRRLRRARSSRFARARTPCRRSPPRSRHSCPRGEALSAWTSTPRVRGPVTTGWVSPRRQLQSVSRYLALELGGRGIRVNLVSAGPLKTTAARGLPSFEHLAEAWAKYAPLGWDTRTPEVVAGSVLLFAFRPRPRGDRRDPPCRRRPARDQRPRVHSGVEVTLRTHPLSLFCAGDR